MVRTDDSAGETSLTPEERAAADSAVATGAGRRAGGRPCTLDSLFAAWRGVVREVEEGYAWCAPEFDDDIWCRSALAGVWPLLPPRVRAMRGPELDGLDARFRVATVPWPDQDEGPHQWWKRRVPRILESEEGEDRGQGWPQGWEMLPFPKPDSVHVVE
ncbi:hypothetical protein I3F58_05190 [Streptomyces sp. MUM 203J]|uniref:hypothetical protein n=1 Tax=Streptomyces sp. MUM 203J TaxID=2791990 RepID=UPI001F04E4B5|nr:hypothetical protein [Streptomyces sp. MUM 203J]MCH0538958.1 hypothetical protein [Streptomyces sp. MUM 203J]